MFAIGVLLFGMSLGGMFGFTQGSNETKQENRNESFVWIMSSSNRERSYDWE